MCTVTLTRNLTGAFRPRVKSVAQQYLDRLTYLQHIEAHPPAMKSRKENIVYYRIAEHYK